MTCKHFTEDFRKEAIRLALNSDLSQHQVADDLGGWTFNFEQMDVSLNYGDSYRFKLAF